MTDVPVKTRKKLIEVALPLDAINAASAREKSIRHGHPSTLHLWWARRPLAAARAVIFAQMVDDPTSYVDMLLSEPETRRAAERELKKRREPWQQRKAEFEAATGNEEVAVPEPGPEPTLEDCAADVERERLFVIIRQLVTWENTTNEVVLQQARDEIWQSWRRACLDNVDHPLAKELFDRHKLPAFHDPFAGGGSLPLEAQRLGLEAFASDLNPVAVLINKAMIEIPPKFAGQPPVNPESRKKKELLERKWRGAEGLAEDVRYYGKWMRDEAEKRIGHLYPKVEIAPEMAKDRPDLYPLVGQKLTVIAWIWARTVKSPNPAFRDVDVPLASTFMLSAKPGKEAYVEPVIENGTYRFAVRVGAPNDAAKMGTKLSRGANFRCLMSGSPIEPDYVKEQGSAGRMGVKLMAIVAEGDRSRVYLPPEPEHQLIALQARPGWVPDTVLAADPRALWTPPYGLRTVGDLFSQRQLTALGTFSDVLSAVQDKAGADAVSAMSPEDKRPIDSHGTGPIAYAEAIKTFLALAIGKAADYWSTIAFWHHGAAHQKIVNTFSRQAIPMSWDYAEGNPFSVSSGHFYRFVSLIGEVLDVAIPAHPPGHADQKDAAHWGPDAPAVVSTDPPYYDNIGYADLSDYFYAWLRRCLRGTFPSILSTIAVPKSEELVAAPYRHGGRDAAEAFFLTGMTLVMRKLAERTHPAFPVTIYYAFKQSETNAEGAALSTGWITFLEAMIGAGLAIDGTWPVRTEYTGNLKKNVGALASSIVISCRRLADGAGIATRRELLNALKAEMPSAVAQLQRGNIPPVDLAQAAIGPGIAVFTRYAKVMHTDGQRVSVGEAYSLINEVLDEVLAKQEGDFDADSRWAITWFDDVGFGEGEFGKAEQLSKSRNTSVDGLAKAGILQSGRGRVRLLKPAELKPDWDPTTDARLTVWEIVHHLIRVLEADGENAAAILLAKIGVRAAVARELAYRLYSICERKKRAAEALSYNGLVQAWPEISRLARGFAAAPPATDAQTRMEV